MRNVPGVLLAALLAGCAAAPPGGERFTATSTLPADLVAAIAAGAVGRVLPFADPTPQFAGAPVRRTGAGWRIELFVDRAGRWQLGGDHRLGVVVPEQAPTAAWPTTIARPWAHGGFAGRPAAVLTIDGSGPGTVVTGRLPADLAQRLGAAVQQHLALAADPAAASGGLDEPNLARTCAHRLLRLAADPQAAGARELAFLRTAQRLGADTAAVHRRVAALERQRGRLRAARDAEWQAVFTSADPRQRADAAVALAAAPTDGPSLRRRAASALADGELALGAGMLHAARRLDDSPLRHRRLRQSLDAQRGDPFVGLANRLLDREASPDPAEEAELAALLAAAGLPRLAVRALAAAPGTALAAPPAGR